MAVLLSPVGGAAAQFLDNNGNPLSGGKLYTYVAGTTTPQATYTTASGVTAHTNPIVLDSGGRVPSGEIWLTDGLQYKFVLKTSTDVLIGTYDNLIGINSNFVNFITQEEIQTATAGQTVFTLGTMQYQPGTNNLSVFVDGVNQYDGASYSYVETSSTVITFTAGLHVGALVKFTTAQTLSTGVTSSNLVTYQPAGTGAVATTVQTKLRETVNVQDFGAVGDGVTDDTAAIQAAIDAFSESIVYGGAGKNYRITSGLTINASNVVFDLNNATLTADFAVGNAITVGSTSVLSGLGVRNGTIITANTSTSLNGVVFKKNVRRNVQYGGLRIVGFKGVGMQFEELNWSIQEKDAPLIEQCGINLDIHDNGNALTISGAGLDGATTYNVRLRGTFGVTFVGGYNQFAGTAGVLMDTSVIGALQPNNSTSFYGVYFEGNGTSHIVGNNGRGLVVNGCYMNCNGMTGVVIDLNSWTGAFIQGNNINSTSGRDFVNADATSTMISVGRQAVTSVNDTLIGGSMNAFISDAFPVPVTVLPTASVLNRGAQFLLAGTGTGANRDLPYICTTIASGSRAFKRMALQLVKQPAQAGSASYTPNITNVQCFDLTVPATGMNIAAPTGAYDDGDEIVFMFKQASASTATVTWNVIYKTDLSASVLSDGYGSVIFRWSAGRSLWIQTGKLEWKV